MYKANLTQKDLQVVFCITYIGVCNVYKFEMFKTCVSAPKCYKTFCIISAIFDKQDDKKKFQ